MESYFVPSVYRSFEIPKTFYAKTGNGVLDDSILDNLNAAVIEFKGFFKNQRLKKQFLYAFFGRLLYHNPNLHFHWFSNDPDECCTDIVNAIEASLFQICHDSEQVDSILSTRHFYVHEKCFDVGQIFHAIESENDRTSLYLINGLLHIDEALNDGYDYLKKITNTVKTGGNMVFYVNEYDPEYDNWKLYSDQLLIVFQPEGPEGGIIMEAMDRRGKTVSVSMGFEGRNNEAE